MNPLYADILDIIKLNCKTKIFVNTVCDGSFLFSDLMNAAKYKFDLYQFTFSCNVVVYTMFKVLNSICSSFFSGVVLDHTDFLYDSIATVLNTTSTNYILDKFTNYFQLFNKHILTVLLKNKKFKINKKLKNIKKLNFNTNLTTTDFTVIKPRLIRVYTFVILNNICCFYKYFTLPFFLKIKINNLFDCTFFLNYSIASNFTNIISLSNEITYKPNFKVENFIFRKFFKKTFQKTENQFFNYSKCYNSKNNNLGLLANSFYINLIQRNNFIKEYLNNYLIKFDSLSNSYDSLASLYSTNKKIKAYHTFFNTVFFKKKLYNIFKMRSKKIIFKKLCQLNDISVSLLTNFNINTIDLNLKNFNSLITHLNVFFSKKFNFLKFYFFLKKLIKFIKMGLKYKLLNSAYSRFKSIQLFNDYRFVNNYASIDLRVAKLKNLLEKIDIDKKKARLDLLKKVQEDLTKLEETKIEQTTTEQSKIIQTATTEQVNINDSVVSEITENLPKSSPEKTLQEKIIEQANELGLSMDNYLNYENFDNVDFLNKDINKEIIYREFLRKDRKIIASLANDKNLNVNSSFFTTNSETLNYKIAGIPENFEPYNLKCRFEYNTNYLNTLGETPNIFDFVDTSILTKYSTKAIFAKLENYFLTISYRELESAHYFKFNNTFLDIGGGKISRSTLFNNKYFGELLYNDFELSKNNKSNDVADDDFSSDFSSDETEQHLNLFTTFDGNNIMSKNNSTIFKKPIFVQTRTLFFNKYITSYNNIYTANKLNFKKIFLLTIYNKRIKNKIYGTYFFKFNRISFKKNNNYKFFSIFFKNYNFFNFKKLNNTKKKFYLKKNIKLISEFS